MQRWDLCVVVSNGMFLQFTMFDLQFSVPSTTLYNGNMDLVSFETSGNKSISFLM